MKPDAENVLNNPLSRLDWDFNRLSLHQNRREEYFKGGKTHIIPQELFSEHKSIYLEIGAGTGGFFFELAKTNPDRLHIALERCKTRGRALVRKSEKAALKNFKGIRANAIPAVIHGVPDASLDRIYILYPCPWPKMSQRKNRWYLHTAMPHFLRTLKPGGMIVWASDQKFYIDEAAHVCGTRYPLKTLVHGQITPNLYNDLEHFPTGRTKFERTFLEQGQPCFELIVMKS